MTKSQNAERSVPAVYSRRLILFLDFLGFKELVDRTTTEPGFLPDLVAAMDVVGNLGADSRGLLRSQEITQFSDSIVVSYDVSDPSAAFWLLADIALCVVDLASRGFLVRGAITVGDLYHTRHHVVGPAMVEAYRLESKVAKTPRVLIDKSVLAIARRARSNQHTPREEANYTRAFMTKDKDGLYFFDYVSWQSVIEVTGGNDRSYGKYLERIGRLVWVGLKHKEWSVREKYLWLHAQYVASIEGFAAMSSGHAYRLANPEQCALIEALPRFKREAAAARRMISAAKAE